MSLSLSSLIHAESDLDSPNTSRSDVSAQDWTRPHAFIAICVLLSSTATVVVFLRIWARRITRGIGYDDWAMIACQFLAIVHAVMAVVMGSHGATLPSSELPEPTVVWLFKMEYAVMPIGTFGNAFGKAAAGLLILRIFDVRGGKDVEHRWLRWSVWGLCGMTMLLAALTTIMLFVQCRPVEATWDYSLREDPATVCMQGMGANNFIVFCQAFNVFVDVTRE
jgi:hypothetical protein